MRKDAKGRPVYDPPLPADEQIKLALAAQAGDEAAAEKLLRSYGALAHDIVWKVWNMHKVEHRGRDLSITKDDMWQECMIALNKAVYGFEDEGNKFVTYAYKTMKNAALGYIRENLGFAHLPKNAYNSPNPMVRDDAITAELVPRDIDGSAKLAKVGNSRYDVLLRDVLPNTKQHNPEELMIAGELRNTLLKIIDNPKKPGTSHRLSLYTPTPKEAEVLRCMLGLNSYGRPRFQSDLAREWGVSRQMISIHYIRGLKKLRGHPLLKEYIPVWWEGEK